MVVCPSLSPDPYSLEGAGGMTFKSKLAKSVSEVYNTFAVRLRTGVAVRS